MEKLRKWLKRSTRTQAKRMVTGADTNRVYLNQVINGHRNLSVEKVARIVESGNHIRDESGNTSLPILTRGDLSKVCATCPHFNFNKGVCNGSEK